MIAISCLVNIGLDFALLQKVRSEIAHREAEGGEGDSGGEGTENVGEATAVSESAASGEAVKAAKKATDKEVSVASISDPVDELQKGCRTNMTKTLIRYVDSANLMGTNQSVEVCSCTGRFSSQTYQR